MERATIYLREKVVPAFAQVLDSTPPPVRDLTASQGTAACSLLLSLCVPVNVFVCDCLCVSLSVRAMP